MSGSENTVMSRSVLCCSLCGEEFSQPKLLHCLHSYCQACLQQHIAKSADTNGHCPDCKTDLQLNDQGVEGLPDNTFIKRLLAPQERTSQKEKECKKCLLLGNKKCNDVSYKCVNCDELLCENCNKMHQQENETSSHVIEPYVQNSDTVYCDQATTENCMSCIERCCNNCDASDTESLFCVNCDILTCDDCRGNYHENHRCADLHAVATNFESRVDEPLADLEDNINVLGERCGSLAEAKMQVEVRRNELRDSVTKRKEFLEEMIENYAQILTAEIDRRAEQNLIQIEQQRVSTENQISSINAVLNFTDNLLAYGRDDEKVAQRKKIGHRIRHLSDIEMPEDAVQSTDVELQGPQITVESVCNFFGELRTGDTSDLNGKQEEESHQHSPCTNQSSIDSGHFSDISGDLSGLGNSFNRRRKSSLSEASPARTLVRRKSVQFDNNVTKSDYEAERIFHLDDPIREFKMPAGIERDCIKGMGINSNGDIIIGAIFTEGHCIYIVEKRGIIRGKIPVDKGWNIHSVASDGKVAMVVNRGDNRFKVRVMKADCSGPSVEESYIQTYGLQFITSNSRSQVIVTSTRYKKLCGARGRSVKSGGNIAVYDENGQLSHRITNESYLDFNLYVMEKPCSVAVDSDNNIYMADSGSHLVAGFSVTGDLLFTYGNSDTNEDEVYLGPDCVALDNRGNLIVTDKRANRIDILTVKGCLKKTFYMDEPPKFVAAGPDSQIMVTFPDGMIKFYEY